MRASRSCTGGGEEDVHCSALTLKLIHNANPCLVAMKHSLQCEDVFLIDVSTTLVFFTC